jgi:hypothetical protein
LELVDERSLADVEGWFVVVVVEEERRGAAGAGAVASGHDQVLAVGRVAVPPRHVDRAGLGVVDHRPDERGARG